MCLRKILDRNLNLSGEGYKVYRKSGDIFHSIHYNLTKEYKLRKTYINDDNTTIASNPIVDPVSPNERYKSGFHVFMNAGDAVKSLIYINNCIISCYDYLNYLRVWLVRVKYEEGHTMGEDESGNSLVVVANKITLQKTITRIDELFIHHKKGGKNVLTRTSKKR